MIKLNCTVQASKIWEKDGKKFNTLTLSVLGVGIMRLTIREEMLPDCFNGREFVGKFSIGVDFKTFKPYVRFLGVE